jgi:predicted RNase H-like nuclease (RuvC/YqgF family)
MNITFPPEILWAIAGFFAVKVVDWILTLKKKDEELKDETIRTLEISIEENSDALLKLRFSIESLEKSIAPLPRIEKDVNEAHTKIRELKAGLGLSTKES